MGMDAIDYRLHGEDMQFVEIELDPGEAAIGEAGSLMYMEDGIEMDTLFGDGSDKHSGVFGKLRGPGTVWLQSLPFARLASRVFAAAPATQGGGGSGGEQGGLFGSIFNGRN